MKKFYRYLIYKMYSWRISKKDDTPISTIIIILTFIHFTQILILYSITGKLFPQFAIFDKLNKIYIGLFFIFFLLFNYLIFYNKSHWQNYLVEFKNESTSESNRGWWLVRIYLIGSVLLFFILMPLLFS